MTEETMRSIHRRSILQAILAGSAAMLAPTFARAEMNEPLDLGGITLTDGSRTIGLTDALPEKPVIVHLWATWCAPCVTELPRLDGFARRLQDSGAGDRLVIVSVDAKPFEAIRRFLAEELDLPDLATWKIAGGPIGSAFRVFGYPASFIVGPGPELLWRHEGPLDWSDDAIAAELFARLGLPA